MGTEAKIEVLLLKRKENDIWETLVKPGKKCKPGAKISFGDGLLVGEVLEVVEEGNRLIKFTYNGIFEEILDELGVSYEMTIISAHREPDVFFEYAKSAESKGFKVIIAGAGMAAHLPGMCAAIFPMPVIGIPMHTTSLGGRDSLYSIVQMPSGIPVATVAINGGANAGLLAAKILATSDAELLQKLKDYSEKLKSQVVAKDAKLQEVGYKKYLEK